jgi:predicted GNAT superfamily acetyltransferase
MVRHQSLDHITWTYDPLLSRNAYLNVAKLGAVCSTYHRSEYGDMRDGLNAGLPSDRFQLDWWINTLRVESRLGKRPRPTLKLNHVALSGLHPFYPIHASRLPDGLPRPPEHVPPFEDRLLLADIPVNFMLIKSTDFGLAREWRFFTRELFETAFEKKYIVTDFIFDNNDGNPRGMYVLTHGESTLDEFE